MSEETQENGVATEPAEPRPSEGTEATESQTDSDVTNGTEGDPSNERRVSYDISEPTDLLEQLENTDLTEEDTEDLLLDAYKMNMMLKEMLKKTPNKGKGGRKYKDSVSKSADNHLNPGTTFPPIHKTKTPLVSTGHPKHAKTTSNKEDQTGSIPKIKISAPKKHVKVSAPPTKQAPDTASTKPKSRGSAGRTERPDSRSSSSRRRSTSVVERPAWDDRFSYS